MSDPEIMFRLPVGDCATVTADIGCGNRLSGMPVLCCEEPWLMMLLKTMYGFKHCTSLFGTCGVGFHI